MTEILSNLERDKSFIRLLKSLSAYRTIEVGNIWGSSYAYIVAGLFSKTKKTYLVISPTEDEADDAVGDLTTFTLEKPLSGLQLSGILLVRELQSRMDCSVISTCIRMLLETLPSPKDLVDSTLVLEVGKEFSQPKLVELLIKNSFVRTGAVLNPFEFSVRGGIVDIFSPTTQRPVRIEFFESKIESIREFDAETQTTISRLEKVVLVLIDHSKQIDSTILEHLPKNTVIVLKDLQEIYQVVSRVENEKPGAKEQFERVLKAMTGFQTIIMGKLSCLEKASNVNFRISPLWRFSGQLSNIPKELDSLLQTARHLSPNLKGTVAPVYIFCAKAGELDRLREILGEKYGIKLVLGDLAKGFICEETGSAFIPNNELFNRYRIKRLLKSSRKEIPTEFFRIERGDCVVHLHHGIGRFLGLKALAKDGYMQDYLVIEYRDATKLYVPALNINLVERYLGGTDNQPSLHTLGGSSWDSAKQRAQGAVRNLAEELLRIQAIRETKTGIRYPEDADWQREFESAFRYEETDDQIEVMKAIKRDMCSPIPMDRLICGDVGYGKTELAMRSAFKAALFNKQIAVLVPTTILAEQHYHTFRERMADYPIRIEVLSRFKTKAEQKEILEDLSRGKIDIIIGTHRLLQPDVKFKDLGLLIIDEEQRFGVEHKEVLKKLRATVDILTLTATPIPRTLHMSLLGIRDISTLSTPPLDRLAIKTQVSPYNLATIKKAILFEMARGGQVFFVHNRVEDIEGSAYMLRKLIPSARIAVAHGQMSEDALEETMLGFLDRSIDVLVCTTIIESGLDIPNANTIIIDNADLFGLADLHQLRGRVGRYRHQAYAYFLLPKDRPISSPQARKRLSAIDEFGQLGAGFKIAMRDLEIRGVGNILGTEQHGHIAAIGYDLYTKLLSSAVKNLKKEKVEETFDVEIGLPVDAYIPEDYIEDFQTRIEIYRKLGKTKTLDDIESIKDELKDRFGKIPSVLLNFIELVHLRNLAGYLKIREIVDSKDGIVMKFLDRKGAEKFVKTRKGYARLIADDTVYIPKQELPDLENCPQSVLSRIFRTE